MAESIRPHDNATYIRLQNKKLAYLGGPSGSGKTYILQMYSELLEKRGTPYVLINMSARYLGGQTLHSIWQLSEDRSIKDYRAFMSNLTESRAINLRMCLVWLIDDVNLMSSALLTWLDVELRKLHGQDDAFGGVQVVLAGDTLQLPPDRLNSEGYPDYVFDSASFSLFHKLSVVSPMRFKGDAGYTRTMAKLRLGMLDDSCRGLIKARCVLVPRGTIFTTICNDPRLALKINEDARAKLPELFHFAASDFVNGKQASVPFTSFSAYTVLPASIQVGPGAVIMLTQNVNITAGLTIGTLAIIERVDVSRVTIIIQYQSVSGLRSVPLRPALDEFSIPQGLAGRRQFPIRLAWAVTTYECSGLTLSAARVHLDRHAGRGEAYTAMSRVRSADCLFISEVTDDSFVPDPWAKAHSLS